MDNNNDDGNGNNQLCSNDNATTNEVADENQNSPKKKYRSVQDFDSREDLKRALLSDQYEGKSSCFSGGAIETGWFLSNQKVLKKVLSRRISTREDCRDGKGALDAVAGVDPKTDWILENYNEETSEKQSVEDELNRLLVLKSYLVLDTEKEESFERITATAREMFHCPIALITLVDLGRQWFLSNSGLPSKERETSRKLAFCAHAIQAKSERVRGGGGEDDSSSSSSKRNNIGCLVVPDAAMDDRFQDNPLVVGPPYIRFYAGAPLISPEGYRLGTLCCIDTVARTETETAQEEFSKSQQDQLIALAAEAMEAIVGHREMKSTWFHDTVLNRNNNDGDNDDDNNNYNCSPRVADNMTGLPDAMTGLRIGNHQHNRLQPPNEDNDEERMGQSSPLHDQLPWTTTITTRGNNDDDNVVMLRSLSSTSFSEYVGSHRRTSSAAQQSLPPAAATGKNDELPWISTIANSDNNNNSAMLRSLSSGAFSEYVGSHHRASSIAQQSSPPQYATATDNRTRGQKCAADSSSSSNPART